ncbi:MAG: glycosyltransferase family 4 protein [Candidatus Bathyarchaeota archaeon]|nr:glycosyltransferase family 4 protein [Candidatus Bathyarchaeota archaeon]
MNKINLAVFNTQPPHLYYGGVERRIIETAKRLTKQINTTVYSGTKAGFKTPTSINRINIIPAFSTNRLYPIDNWFFNKTIARYAKNIIADVYESHTVSGYQFIKILRKQKRKEPFIQTIHGVLADEYLQAAKTRYPSLQAKIANLVMWRLSKLEKQAAKKANLIITISNYTKNKIIELYSIKKEKIRIVPNGVDLQKFKPLDKQIKIKNQFRVKNRPCLLFVGRLIPRKGLSFLVQAAKQIIKEENQTIFLIVGEGPQKNQLISDLKRNRLLKNFIFLGDVKEKDLPLIYNCADIFVFPSIQEAQGIALLEAQATSKPVVSFNTGGISETVLDQETGILIDPDSNKLAITILKLLKNKELREKMGKKGREFVSENFTWDKCSKALLEIYKEVISKSK